MSPFLTPLLITNILQGTTMKYAGNLAWLLFLITWGANAQTFDLSLISTYPEDGAVNVPEQVTLSLAFSAPLDTTAYYDVSEFFLAAQSFPEIVDPEIMLSEDRTTVEFLVRLDPNTRYVVFLTGGRSETGAGLDRPYAFTFTTGVELPPGSMSGNVDIPTSLGDSPRNYGLVALFQPDPSSPGFFQDGLEPVGMAISDLNGDYQASYIPAGAYIVVGANDENEDGEIDPLGGDGFRFYDNNGDGLADPVTIGDAAIGGIDFPIMIPLSASARDRYDGAQQVATGIESDVELVALLGEVDPAGQSPVWILVFYTPGADRHFGILCFGDQFSIEGAPADGFDPITPLPDGWLDSDDAIAVANDNGGSQFIQTYPDAQIAAAAGTFTPAPGKNEEAAGHPLSLPFGHALVFRDRLSSFTDGTPIWLFVYISEMGQTAFDVRVHAVTGIVVANEEEAAVITQPVVLEQNYPNPLRLETTISYQITEESAVRLAVYDVLGREVQVLQEGWQPPGRHEVRWTGIDAAGNRLSDGLYLYRLEAAGTIRTRILVLLR